ncbi:hypothetical protein BDZ90DRAFT_87857 [Jaminaea rosea]|uniref:Uncharacterized protein n=1 Tax=Jaminaea rosea TaxID=1569628 RepID=A0A316UI40_9BASI|nr:hypothetical protein BDZ90DRAFT_87857 [Jaminaea rosea]PWN24879.1 hypothetical protein BDZ90DRAFT_87857 [Jaminaea rosea]
MKWPCVYSYPPLSPPVLWSCMPSLPWHLIYLVVYSSINLDSPAIEPGRVKRPPPSLLILPLYNPPPLPFVGGSVQVDVDPLISFLLLLPFLLPLRKHVPLTTVHSSKILLLATVMMAVALVSAVALVDRKDLARYAAHERRDSGGIGRRGLVEEDDDQRGDHHAECEWGE